MTQRLKMSPFSKKRIVHFIGFLNRAHQDEKSDMLQYSKYLQRYDTLNKKMAKTQFGEKQL